MDNSSKHMAIMKLVHLAILILLIFAVFIYFFDIRKSQKEKDFDRFMVFLGQYDEIVKSRNECFKRIYYAFVESDNFRAEKLKDFNSLNYILWRLSDDQPELVAIENELLVLEIQCISYINKLCEIAVDNREAFEIIRLKESYEMYFFTSRFGIIYELYESQRSALKLDELDQNSIRDVFEGRFHPGKSFWERALNK